MGRDQAERERLEAANVSLGGAVDDLKAARRILADRNQTRIRRAEAAGQISAISKILECGFGVRA
jgi:hypothetical protein